MKLLFAFLIFFSSTLIAFPLKPLKLESVHTQKSSSELWKEFEAEPKAENKFYLLDNVVKEYCSEIHPKKDQEMIQKRAEMLLEMAEKYKKTFAYNNARHHAHLALGRLQLQNGNIEGAKAELKKAIDIVPGSPQLNSFGPNMTLAKELLEKKEITAVLDYLEASRKFWLNEFSDPKIKEWTPLIKAGQIPDFRGNLIY